MGKSPVLAESPTPAWTNIVNYQNPPKPNTVEPIEPNRVFIESCKSTKGMAVAVIDANAVIQGGENLSNYADKFITVPEVMHEIRDPVSRNRLSFIPFTIETMEPSPESVKKVIKFAKATGDLQTLSDVDLKLIALTYTLEAQIHGVKHLRDCPPPVHTVNVKRLPERELPGWGSNVPNLEEWEALENAVEDKSNSNSKILPLQGLNLDIMSQDGHSEDGSTDQKSEVPSDNQESGENSSSKAKRYQHKKKEVKIEGKKMVSDGIDASQGQFGDDAGDWMPAVSRSTHRRYLRRKARREYYEAMSQKDQQEFEEDMNNNQIVNECAKESCVENGASEVSKVTEESEGKEELSGILEQMRLEEDSSKNFHGDEPNMSFTDLPSNNCIEAESASGDHQNVAAERGEVETIYEGLEPLETASHTADIVDGSCADDDSGEKSWKLRSLSESTVACITGDYSMQNVLLQIGLRLVAPGGAQIRELHRWVLKCHACYTVTTEIGRIFCPKCGNGGTLRKVVVMVGENGIVLAARRQRITLRGTKFSLPLPQGGRDAITKNLILREDQLPQKFLHQKTKKKANKQDDDFYTLDSVLGRHHTDKKAPFQPPIRKALAVFSGKRNPNDNHYWGSKHK